MVAFPAFPLALASHLWRTVTSFVDEGRNGLDGVSGSILVPWEYILFTQDTLDNSPTRASKCTRIRRSERRKGMSYISTTHATSQF